MKTAAAILLLLALTGCAAEYHRTSTIPGCVGEVVALAICDDT